MVLVDIRLGAFHAFLDPAAALRIADVHELGADGATVGLPGLLGEIAFDLQLRIGNWLQKTERVKVSF